jgi:uncharacterized phiE125 gp8 family phage protein
MPQGLSLITPPAVEPLTVSQAKDWLRVDSDDATQDTVIGSLIKAARVYAEKATGRAFITQRWLATYDRFPRYSSSAVWTQYADALWDQRIPQTELSGKWWPDKATIRLPKPPLQQVVSVLYIDTSGAQVTLDPSQYVVDTTTEPGRIAPSYGNIWPIIRQQLGAVQVSFFAGYGADASAVPDTLLTALKLLVAAWFENREAVAAGAPQPVPLGVEALLGMEWTGEYT